jgi:hypothetical protein
LNHFRPRISFQKGFAMRFFLTLALLLGLVAYSEAGCRGGRHRERHGLLSRIFHRDKGNHDEGGDDSEGGCASGQCATPNYGVGQAPEKMPEPKEVKKPKPSD